MRTIDVLLETSDLSRLLGVTTASIRRYLRAGHLQPDYMTPRGGRLFRVATVERFRQGREARKAALGQRTRKAVRIVAPAQGVIPG